LQTRNLRAFVFTALFAALFIAMSMIAIRLSFSPVPITLQTLAVILSGIFLAPRQAFLSIFIVIVLTAFGLPLFNGKGGLAYLFGTTGGFIMSFPFLAMLISLAVNKLLQSPLARRGILPLLVCFLLYEVVGLLAYIPGIPWMMNVVGFSLPKALAAGFYPFIIGDALKALAAASLTIALFPYIRSIRASAKENTTVQSSIITNK